MASFSAELHLAGHVFPVTHCHFDVTQATQLRGRVSAKVRYGPVQLVLDVPDGDVLPAWAADPHKQQATAVVFLDATGGQPLETLHLPSAYCVAYQEQFSSGDAVGGAYQCFLTLSDPSGWTIAPGGPTTAFMAPAAREHGQPGAAVSGLRDRAIGGATGAGASTVAVPTAQEKARFAALNHVWKKRTLEPAEEQELVGLLATVAGIYIARLAQLTPKPKHSPTPAKWRSKNGRIDILPNGYWQYTDQYGNAVTYEPDEPNFDAYARQAVKIDDMQGDCTSDFDKADEKAAQGKVGPKEDTNTWHHKNDLQTMQEVPSKIHSRFTHYGARSIIRKKNVAAGAATSATSSTPRKSILRKKKP